MHRSGGHSNLRTPDGASVAADGLHGLAPEQHLRREAIEVKDLCNVWHGLCGLNPITLLKAKVMQRRTEGKSLSPGLSLVHTQQPDNFLVVSLRQCDQDLTPPRACLIILFLVQGPTHCFMGNSFCAVELIATSST